MDSNYIDMKQGVSRRRNTFTNTFHPDWNNQSVCSPKIAHTFIVSIRYEHIGRFTTIFTIMQLPLYEVYSLWCDHRKSNVGLILLQVPKSFVPYFDKIHLFQYSVKICLETFIDFRLIIECRSNFVTLSTISFFHLFRQTGLLHIGVLS